MIKPTIKAHMPQENFSFELISGNSSSTITYIMAPAENDKSQGNRFEIDVDKKYPGIAKIGSTTPLIKASQKDLCLFVMHE